MTLRADLTALLAQAGITDVDVDEAITDEHVRSAAYLRVIAVTAASRSREGDRAIVAAILREPEEIKSKTAVVCLIDTIAVKTAGPAEFHRWSAGLTPELDRFQDEGNREFIRRRIHDWAFYLSIRHGHLPTPSDLADVTDWMQRLLAEESTSPPVLALLAESGSTGKIRNIANNRARKHAPRTN